MWQYQKIEKKNTDSQFVIIALFQWHVATVVRRPLQLVVLLSIVAIGMWICKQQHWGRWRREKRLKMFNFI